MDLAPEIRCFALIARLGSLTRAAASLGVPRSTVSRRLARLEDHLGERLIERTTRHLRLTDAGELVLERSVPVLRAMDELVDDVRGLGGTPRGRLRVSVPPGVGQSFQAEFIRLFHERCPLVRLEVVATSSPPNLLAEGFDVALRDDTLEDSPWIRHPIGPAGRLAVATPSYLSEHGRPGTLADLAEHKAVAMLSGGEDTVWPLRDGGGLAVDPILRVNDLETLRLVVLDGLGIGVLPFYIVAFDLVHGRMEAVLPAKLGNERTLVALFPEGRRQSAKIRGFLDAIDTFAAQRGQDRDRLSREPESPRARLSGDYSPQSSP